jgi:hypothetical protein
MCKAENEKSIIPEKNNSWSHSEQNYVVKADRGVIDISETKEGWNWWKVLS